MMRPNEFVARGCHKIPSSLARAWTVALQPALVSCVGLKSYYDCHSTALQKGDVTSGWVARRCSVERFRAEGAFRAVGNPEIPVDLWE